MQRVRIRRPCASTIQSIAQYMGKLVDDDDCFIREGIKQMNRALVSDKHMVFELMDKWIRMKRLNDSQLFDYIENEVWSSVMMTSFFMERPFEWVISKQHGKALTQEYLDFIDSALKRGADTDYLATTLVPSFATSLVYGNRTLSVPIANLLLTFSHTCQSSLLQDRKLLDALASHLKPMSGIVCPVVELCLSMVDTMVVVDLKEIVYKLHYIITSSALSNRLNDKEVVGIFKLFTVLSKTDEWHRYIAFMAVSFVKHNLKPYECIHLIFALLDSESVLFLILLARSNLLEVFREGVGTLGTLRHDGTSWMDVYHMTNRKWPNLSTDIESSFEDDEETCPITLCSFVNPVVASDGHTYERSALLRHLAENGMTSPITKQPLTFSLYDNWVTKRSKKQRVATSI